MLLLLNVKDPQGEVKDAIEGGGVEGRRKGKGELSEITIGAMLGG